MENGNLSCIDISKTAPKCQISGDVGEAVLCLIDMTWKMSHKKTTQLMDRNKGKTIKRINVTSENRI